MTTVRFTKEVRNKIVRSCTALFNKRVTEAGTFFMDEGELASMILDTWLDQCGFAAAWGQIPAEHLAQSGNVFVGSLNGWTPDDHRRLHLPRDAPQSPTIREPGYHVVHERFEPIVVKWRAWQAERKIVYAEAEVFKKRVVDFVQQHSTLRSALAAWPQLWEVIPDDLRLVHNMGDDASRHTYSRGVRPDMSDATAVIVKTKILDSLIA